MPKSGRLVAMMKQIVGFGSLTVNRVVVDLISNHGFSGAGAEGYRGDRDGRGSGGSSVAEHDDIRVTCRGVVFDD